MYLYLSNIKQLTPFHLLGENLLPQISIWTAYCANNYAILNYYKLKWLDFMNIVTKFLSGSSE